MNYLTGTKNMVKKVAFKNRRGLTLRGYVHVPKRFDTAVVYCHGFPSSSRGTTSPRVGRMLENAGFLVLRFDFSGTPNSDGKFENKLMSSEVADIRSAIDFLYENFRFNALVLYGESTGAIDASLYGHTDKRLAGMIVTGIESDLKHSAHYEFTDEQVRDFWTKGFAAYRQPRHWVNGKKLRKVYYDEFFTLDVPRAMKRFHRPLLVVHGERDIIPWKSEGYAFYRNANRPKRFVLVKGADH